MRHSELLDDRTRGLSAVIAALLVAMLLVAAEPAAASHYTNTTELGGSTNPAVAASWSKATFASSANEVLLGRDDVFADSLASGGMQGSRPLLLTNSQALSSEARAEMDRLNPTVVNILGGASAVSAAVEQDLQSRGYTTRRFSGPTRIETAIDVARRALPTATSAIVAAAFAPAGGDATRAFADSIAAGGWAADRNMPVLLTETQRLSVSTKNYLRGALVRTVFVVGGTSAVSDAAVRELQEIGMTVRRISGPTRFDTAVSIAKERGFADASKAGEVILNEGQAADAWAAGFAAAAYSAAKDAPIVLSNGDSVPSPTAAWLAPTAKAASTKLVCAPRVNEPACDAASEAMGHTAITGSTPRLLAVAAGATSAGATQVRFTFTEPVAAQVTANRFKIYAYDTTVTTATSAVRDSARQDVVVATFPQAAYEESTLAAVAAEAVRSLSSNVPNAEGSSPLHAYTPPTGETRVANLVDTAMANQGDDEWDVNFVFDRGVACGASARYKLVAVSDTETTGITVIDGTDIVSVPGEPNTCQVTFVVDDPGVSNNSHVSRYVVERAGATGSGQQIGNVPGADRVGAPSAAPDLQSVERVNANQLRFVFDQNIDAAVNVNQAADRFKVYDSRGNEFAGSSATVDVNRPDGVIVGFDSGFLRNVLMRGFVGEDAVKGALSGLSAGLFNGPDAVPMAASFTSGETSGPRLTSITRTTSGSGATAQVTLRFTYDATVDRGTGGYFVYTDAGERIQLTTCSVVATAGSDDVDCVVGSSNAAQYAAALGADVAGASYDAVRAVSQSGDPIGQASPAAEHGGTIA